MRFNAPILAAALALAASPAAAQEEAAATCLRDTAWGPQIAPWDQKMAFELIREEENRAVVGIRFSPLQGAYAKLFGFFLFEGDCVTQALIVGAFASANDFRNVEELPAGTAVRYHQDYITSATQATLDVTLSPPDYGATRALALGMLH